MKQPRALPDAPDEHLVRAVGAGDAGALAVLVARHEPALLRLGQRVTGSESAAQDITQDVWLKLWARKDHYDPRRGLFSAWLKRVTVNRAIDWLRRARPAEDLDDHDLPAPAREQPQHLADAARTAQRVRDAVEALPGRQREAILLCYYGGLTAPEAAVTLRLSAPAVEALLVRARRTLRLRLADLMP